MSLSFRRHHAEQVLPDGIARSFEVCRGETLHLARGATDPQTRTTKNSAEQAEKITDVALELLRDVSVINGTPGAVRNLSRVAYEEDETQVLTVLFRLNPTEAQAGIAEATA